MAIPNRQKSNPAYSPPSAHLRDPARRRRRVYALAKGAVEGDLGEGALENGELLVVQLGEE
jgi:hypothetical protein